METTDSVKNSMTGDYLYTALGLHLQSEIPLPELVIARNGDLERVTTVKRCDHNLWPRIQPNPHSTKAISMSGNELRLEIENIGHFRAINGDLLERDPWNDSVREKDIRIFLNSSGLGAIAIQQGKIAFHATALEKDGQAILLVGHPSSGKSTVAFCLLTQGWKLISSELSTVNEKRITSPGIHQLKLWHDAATELGIDTKGMERARKNLWRYLFTPDKKKCQEESTKVKYIFHLERVESPGFDELYRSPRLSEQHSLLLLRNSAFHARFYRGLNKESELFIRAAEITRSTPSYNIYIPNGVRKARTALEQADLLNLSSMTKIS